MAERALTADEVRAAERPLLDAGVPLMARAAAALAEQIALRVPLPGDPRTAVLVLVGGGDNGGDALFAAAHLADRGADVQLVRTGSRVHEGGWDAATAAGARELPLGEVVDAAIAAAVVVDGILGIGTESPALREPARSIVEAIRPVTDAPDGPLVVAVDLPSGVHPDTGAVPDATVLRADLTVTFGAMKAGLLRRPAADYAGEIVVVDIGLQLPGD